MQRSSHENNLGVLTQAELYRELVNVRYVEGKRMPAFRTLQWSWFFVAMFFVYGETLRKLLSIKCLLICLIHIHFLFYI